VLARVADADGRDDDDEHDGGVDPFAGERGGGCGEHEHQQKRVAQLIQQDPDARQLREIADPVRSLVAEPPFRVARGKPFTRGPQRVEEWVGVTRPIGAVVRPAGW
jgi:hypothetical protein